MKVYKELVLDEERALYNQKNIDVINCKFDGPKDGESALKECEEVHIRDCYFNLRYPFWHTKKAALENCELTENCRAAFWYCNYSAVNHSKLNGIKAFRECKYTVIANSEIDSKEFGWRCSRLNFSDCKINSEYFCFETNYIYAEKIDFTGKYSFQYCKDVIIKNSVLKTKDAFWHANNVKVYDSVLEGEYLGWYSKNLTLIRCHIKGTQPLCYCKNLKLIDCTMENTDLSFEYSSVKADINGNIVSVKNPRKGYINAHSINEIVHENDKYKGNCKIMVRDIN
jgi:hypothetical protein